MRRSKHSITQPWSFVKALFKQANHIIVHKMIWWQRRHSAPVKYVYFYPESPHPYTVVYRTFHILGIRIINDLPSSREKSICFWWQDDTFVPDPQSESFINGRCLDISKEHVDAIHQRIFNYSLTVDPLSYTGEVVVKSNLNGTHDGFVVKGPLKEVNTSCVYQRVVDNRPIQQPDYVCDIRVAVFNGKPTIGYLKFRPVDSRFSNKNSIVNLLILESALTVAELDLIQQFCQEIGLDYGEIDVVRDVNDGRIFVLDINKTPLGPPNGLSLNDSKTAQERYCSEFSNWLGTFDRG